MGLRIDAAVYSHIGRRSNNEDNFFVNGLYMERDQMNKGGQYHAIYSNNEQMYAVCDGMGGAEFGEEASYRAVHALKEYRDTCEQPDSASFLNDMIAKASDNIDNISISKGMPSGSSGSTIAMLILHDWYCRMVHVGDSRIYRLRDGLLERMTKDDSEVQLMVDRGEITLDEAWQHPRKNVIIRHLGMPTEGSKLLPTISKRIELKRGDRFLLCSDGLSDALHDSFIRDILIEKASPSNTASQLVRMALRDMDRIGIESDNITVIVLDVLDSKKEGSEKLSIRRFKILRGLLSIGSLVSFGGLIWTGIQLVQLILR